LAKRQSGLLDRFGIFLRFDTAWAVDAEQEALLDDTELQSFLEKKR